MCAGDIQLTLCQNVQFDAAVVVTTPQKLAFIDVAKGIRMFARMAVPCIAVAENMAYFDADGKRHRPFGEVRWFASRCTVSAEANTWLRVHCRQCALLHCAALLQCRYVHTLQSAVLHSGRSTQINRLVLYFAPARSAASTAASQLTRAERAGLRRAHPGRLRPAEPRPVPHH
jgi:NUBPL iron-transfer P-loop NTPase